MRKPTFKAKISIVASKGRKRIEVAESELSADELLTISAYFFHAGAKKLGEQK